ncbi:hypothetical protein GCM10022223_56880 [Kineosporia mesophila]|uniref:DUF2946 domain-containing protein n=1 Tax=Kineosporia mesophila TaxID=566012 RepID=A0ABP7AGD4_9ACTN
MPLIGGVPPAWAAGLPNEGATGASGVPDVSCAFCSSMAFMAASGLISPEATLRRIASSSSLMGIVKLELRQMETPAFHLGVEVRGAPRNADLSVPVKSEDIPTTGTDTTGGPP